MLYKFLKIFQTVKVDIMKYKFFLKYIFYLILFIFLSFFILNILFPFDKTYLNRLQSKMIFDRDNNLIHTVLSADGYWRFHTEIEELPQILIDSVLQFEDKYFYYHPGINPFSILRSAVHNMKSNHRIGASTITMQVARMMNRRPRTYSAKFIEIFRALQMEIEFTKDEILEFYFNLAPYGGNIEGVKTASFFYFGKTVKNLSISEAALLSIIPKHPNKNRPDRYANIGTVRNKLLKKLYRHKIITQDQYNRATNEPVASHRRKSVMKHPHYTLRSEIIDDQDDIIITTLDSQLQHYVETLLKVEVEKNSIRGISNAATIVVNNNTMEIMAYAGSSNFYNKRNGGQNDGVTALRSPGSLLKPFIYALAMDKGLITPSKLVFDIPLNFRGYSPVNFDRKYRGFIDAKEALQLSLNVPAVDINNMLGENSLFELLTDAGILSISKEKSYYGTSIVLGGAEMSLENLIELYLAFSNEGKKGNLVFKKNSTKVQDGRQMFSKEAAYLISDILSEGYRDEFVISHDALSVPKVAFKTGTSAGLKDLWTIGFTKDYTVGVWMGNFDGSGADGATGIRSASKPVFDIFQYLHRQEPLNWLEKPKSIVKQVVCVDPVFLTDKLCKRWQSENIIKGAFLHFTCMELSNEKIQFLIEEGEILSLTKLYENKCYRQMTQKKPIIISPQDKAYIVRSKVESDSGLDTQKILLNCYSFQVDGKINWFVDGKNTLSTKSGETVFIDIDSGEHTIRCVDALSQTTSINITIEN